MRRKIAMKRTVSELEGYKELYFSILKIIRANDETLLRGLVAAVRGNTSLDGIATIISASIHEMQLRATPSSRPSNPFIAGEDKSVSRDRRLSGSRSRHAYMSLEDLCDLAECETPKSPLDATC